MDNDLSKTHFQNITLTFSNGQTVKASVPATIPTHAPLALKGITISEPSPLPDGITWTKLSGDNMYVYSQNRRA